VFQNSYFPFEALRTAVFLATGFFVDVFSVAFGFFATVVVALPETFLLVVAFLAVAVFFAGAFTAYFLLTAFFLGFLTFTSSTTSSFFSPNISSHFAGMGSS